MNIFFALKGSKRFIIISNSIRRIKFSNDSQPPDAICKEFYKGMLALSDSKQMSVMSLVASSMS